MADNLAANIIVKHIRYVQIYIQSHGNNFEYFNNYK